MKNTDVLPNVLESDVSKHLTRNLTIAIMCVATLLMFGLAITANAETLVRQLEVGSRGQDVSDLQTFLALDNTIYPQGLVTGYFGLLTKAAVSNFQSKNGIPSVGRVGPLTLAALNAQMGVNPANNGGVSPAIFNVNVSKGSNYGTITWNTDQNAAAIIYYGTTFPSMVEASPTTGVTIGGQNYLVHTDQRSSHSGTLTGLQANTTYYYVVYVRDASGNESVTWPATFQTNS